MCKGFFIFRKEVVMAKLCVFRNINAANGKHVHGHTFKIEVHFHGELVNNMVRNTLKEGMRR